MQDDSNNDAIIDLPQQQQDGNNEQHERKKNKRPLSSANDEAAVTTVPPVATITRLTTGRVVTLVRTLPPYLYTFTSFAKGRWVGRTVLDVYCDEFGAYPASYYR
jgi:hypothetical protein